MSPEIKLTKEKVLEQVSVDLHRKGVKLFERGHSEAGINLLILAQDINTLRIKYPAQLTPKHPHRLDL